jgi:hypothetical protein
LNGLHSTISLSFVCTSSPKRPKTLISEQHLSLRSSDLSVQAFGVAASQAAEARRVPSAHRQTRCIAESWQLQQRCETSFSELCNSNRMIYKPACSGTLGSLFSTKLSTTSYVRAGPRCLSRPPLSPNFCLSTNTFRRRPIECRNMATLSAQRKHKVTVVGSGNWYVLHRLRRSKWQDVVMLQPSERS